MDIYAKRELVYKNELSEIDIQLQDEFGFDWEKHDDFIINGDSNGYADAYPINIEEVIQELVNMKDAGATHVEIGYHCDHIGYIFEGYRIKSMTTEEVENVENEKKAEEEKQKKIAELKRQIQMLENNSTYGAHPKQDISDNLPF